MRSGRSSGVGPEEFVIVLLELRSPGVVTSQKQTSGPRREPVLTHNFKVWGNPTGAVEQSYMLESRKWVSI